MFKKNCFNFQASTSAGPGRAGFSERFLTDDSELGEVIGSAVALAVVVLGLLVAIYYRLSKYEHINNVVIVKMHFRK